MRVMYLRSMFGVVVKESTEFDDVRKLRLVTLEMGAWGRELLGCSSNLTINMGAKNIKGRNRSNEMAQGL